MDNDYPAAHSMDCQWFAVDRDGHVAVFESGEAGAVPSVAFDQSRGDIQEWARENLHPAQAIREPYYTRMPSGEAVDHWPDRAFSGSPVLLFLTTLDPVRDALAAGAAEEVPVTEGYGVVFRQLADADLERYLQLPECVRSANLYFDDGDGNGDPSLARFGFYTYDHLTDNWVAGPYGREAVPARPLHVDELPPGLRALASRVRFDLRFGETMHLQPAELTECESWGPAYLDSTGTRIRPLPGKEQEYAEAIENDGYAQTDRYQVEPPRQV